LTPEKIVFSLTLRQLYPYGRSLYMHWIIKRLDGTQSGDEEKRTMAGIEP
jgi:hypothetical protein